MLIVYCDACNLRILQKDLDSGGAVQLEENKYLCAKCAPAHRTRVPTSAMPLPVSRETPSASRTPTAEIRQSKTTVRTIPRASEKSMGAVPMASTSGASSTARRAAVAGDGSAKPKSMMVPMIAGGVGLLIFLIGIYVALSGKSDMRVAESPKNETPTQVPASPATVPMSQEAMKKLADSAAPAASDDEGAKRRNLPSWMQNDNAEKNGLRGADSKAGAVELKKPNAAEVPSEDSKRVMNIAESQKKENDEVIFFDDGPPVGATLDGSLKSNSWKWVQKPEPVYSGSFSHTFAASPAGGIAQHYFINSSAGLKVNPSDVLFAYVYIDPKWKPTEVMMQWSIGNNWEHRAYWGEDGIPWGQNFSPSRLPMGTLPKTGEWVRLEVPANQIGVEAPTQINGWSFDHVGGVVYWDKAGVQVKPAAVASADPKKDPTAPPGVPPPPPASTPPSEKTGASANPFALAVAGDSTAPVTILWKEFKGGGDFNDFHGSDKRPSKAIWGKNTKKPKITATFTMPPGDYSVGVLKVTSIKHGNPDPCLISFTLNGQEIFSGKDRSKSAAYHWGEETYEIPSGALRAGTNELLISNIEDSDHDHSEPWYMINKVEIRATLNPEKAFPPIVSETQRAKLQLYEKSLEALLKKDPEVVMKLEGVLKMVKVEKPAAANVFAAADAPKNDVIELPLAGGVERALELHTQALENFRKKPPAEPIAVDKLKTTGTIARVDGSKVFVKAGGIELSVDITAIPQTVFYKTLAIDESKPAGLNDKAAWFLGLGQMDDVQGVLKKVPKDSRAPWTTFLADYASLDKLTKFEAALTNAQQMLAHGKADTALILLNGVKKDYPEFLDANQERMAFLAKRMEGLQKK